MGKKKIFNDPLYGLISFKNEIIYEVIDEPEFQRLRRIKQMGMSDLVYSGATHPRFQHVIGATYLLTKAMDELRSKGVEITDKEYESASIAMLCHDLGHGPFSHALEGLIVETNHEEITKLYLSYFEKKYGEPFTLAIQIFENKYHKEFLHQLISSQLDMDRLDYLSRDSYYTGVVEGIVGYDRILNMINVANNRIVVEEKGVNSVEKFLIARYMMYSQVYLHKTSVSAEFMLKKAIEESKENLRNNILLECGYILKKFLNNEVNLNEKELFIYYFSLLDDNDIWYLIKSNLSNQNILLKFLCKSLLNRKLFKVSLHSQIKDEESTVNYNNSLNPKLSYSFHELIECYKKGSQSILIQTKEGLLYDLADFSYFSSLLNRNKEIHYTIELNDVLRD